MEGEISTTRMNFNILAVTIISAFGSTFANFNIKSHQSQSSQNQDSLACSREVEGIVYQPISPASTYLNRISQEIKIASPLLWTADGNNFLQSFEQKYAVTVIVRDPFRTVVYPVGSSIPQDYTSTTSTANLNGDGFVRDTTDEVVMNEFIVYNPYGELKYVSVSVPLINSPVFKK